MAESNLDRMLRRQGWMEPVGDFVQNLVGGAYRLLGPLGPPIKDVAHGTSVLRHPLHPALTDAPLGLWIAAAVADWLALGRHWVPTQAGDVALAAGVVAALGAVLTGYTDFHATYGLERRTALTHGLLMTVVFAVQCLSLAMRWWGGADLHGAAVGLSTAGTVLAAVGMYVGGHLVYRFGTMVDRNAFTQGPSRKFVDVGAGEDFPEGSMKRVDVRGMAALAVRLEGRVYAIGAVCTHAGGPLDEGELEGDVVTCPWHGSKFCVRDGRVRGGPATFSEPDFEVQEQDGRVGLKLRFPLH